MKQTVVLLSIVAAFYGLGCATMGVPAGSPETGWSIYGYVGRTANDVAVGERVALVDGKTGQEVTAANADMMGKYVFSYLQPGHYVLQVGKHKLDAQLGQENLRLDVDMSAADGRMNYLANAMKEAAKDAKKGGGGKGAIKGNPGDPALVQNFAGKYWGYSGGSTLSGSGGTERSYGFCPDGSYREYSESSYSGSSSDQYGNETMNWGAAGQGGSSGSWSMSGTMQKGTISLTYSDGSNYDMSYEAGNEAGCYYFDGNQMCRTGGCD